MLVLVYGGPEVAAQQTKAFPDIAPIQSNKPAAEAYAEALQVGKAMGWEIVAEDSKAFRFEAVARSAVYQFADDVVVAVTAQDNGSRIDIRSLSRGVDPSPFLAKYLRSYTAWTTLIKTNWECSHVRHQCP